jgi:hypothetical protein
MAMTASRSIADFCKWRVTSLNPDQLVLVLILCVLTHSKLSGFERIVDFRVRQFFDTR